MGYFNVVLTGARLAPRRALRVISHFVLGLFHGFHVAGGNRIGLAGLVGRRSGLGFAGLARHDARQAKKLHEDPDVARREFHGVWRNGVTVDGATSVSAGIGPKDLNGEIAIKQLP